MKFIAVALTLALSQASASKTSLRQDGDKVTTKRDLQLVEPACNLFFEFTMENAGCDCNVDREAFDEILQELRTALRGNGCSLGPRNFLRHISGLGADAPGRELRRYLKGLCRAAHSNQIDEATPFGDITNEGALFDKEYYDGGTYYNEERETEEFPGTQDNPAFVLEDHPGADIEAFFENEAQNWNVEFPSYMTNFEECQYNAAMCCFVQDRQADDDNGNCDTPYDENCVDADPADNTDICYTDAGRAPVSTRVQDGFAIFAGDDDDGEGDAHCHGFAWADDETHPSSMYKGNNLFYISMYDHLYQRGYVRNVPGAPMCSCLEQAPVVSRSDCTEIECVTEELFFEYENGELNIYVSNVDIEFNACQGLNEDDDNDLFAYYERLVDEGLVEDQTAQVLEHIVGDDQCPDAIKDFLTEKIDSLGLLD